MKDLASHILVNVVYNNSIVGEIIIRYGEKPANFYSLKFLTDLANSFNILEFQEHVWNWCDRLQDQNKFYKREIIPEKDKHIEEQEKKDREKAEKEQKEKDEKKAEIIEKSVAPFERSKSQVEFLNLPVDSDEFITPYRKAGTSRENRRLQSHERQVWVGDSFDIQPSAIHRSTTHGINNLRNSHFKSNTMKD